jgi:hypothetical protein
MLSLTACGAGTDATQGAKQQARSESTACDRECLTELAKSYLGAVVSGDTSAVPLAADIAFVENVTRMKPGEGLWANAVSGPTEFAIYVPDAEQQQVGLLTTRRRAGSELCHQAGSPCESASCSSLWVSALTRSSAFMSLFR